MVIVYVWNMGIRDKAGHAAVQVGKTYISWWPEHYRSDVGLGFSGAQLGWGGPSYSNSMREDRQHKQRYPDYASAPIQCLDEAEIHKWWESVRPKNNYCQATYSKTENIHYDLARLSCATIALRALLAGGAAKISPPPVPLIAAALKGVASLMGVGGGLLAEYILGEGISPMDVKRYAEALATSKQNIE